MDGSILNAFGTLSIVVVALGALLYLVKKTAQKKISNGQLLDMKILSRMNLNAKNHLYIVQAGDKKLLLGVSESGIRNLTELNDNISSNENYVNDLKKMDSKSNLINNDDSLSFRSFIKSTFSVGQIKN
jgi:flagellar biosynthetic protein FliO